MLCLNKIYHVSIAHHCRTFRSVLSQYMYQSSYFANINSAATQDTYIKSNCHGNTAVSFSDC
jgi:hypothetical protein